MKEPSQLNFLIVDDVDNMRRSIKAMLKLINFGREFYEAANGEKAWQIIQESGSRVDFIISDYHMPKMSGTELLVRVRGEKGLRDIPFLMITAEANMEVVAEAAEHEVDAYLTKPFVTATLEQKILELLHCLYHPSETVRNLRQARELSERGDIVGAMALIERSVDPERPASRPLRELGRLNLKLDRLEESRACFKKAIRINRLDVSSYHYLGQIYHRLGRVDQAIDYFARAMQISPRHYERAIGFARLLLRQQQRPEAEKVLRMLIRQPELQSAAREEIAEICRSHGFELLAVRLYRSMLKENPHNHGLAKKLGLTLYRMGEPSEAARILEKVAEREAGDLDLMLDLARIYLEMKFPVRADKWAMRVLRRDPDNVAARGILELCG